VPRADKKRIRSLLVLVAFGILLAGCSERKPLKIGFVGPLTGRNADLGIAGRDAVMLAVERINDAGGINGRQVQLIIRDDRQDPATAVEVDQELIADGVVVIIGHMTSAMSVAAVPTVNGAQVLMVSPTTSSNELTGLDDHFLRVYPPNSSVARRLAAHARNRLGLKRMAIVYDLANRGHTQGWSSHFRAAFEAMGGRIAVTSTFDSGQRTSFLKLARDIIKQEPDGIFFIANALDTATFCQQLRKLGSRIPVVVSEWSTTDELITHGGSAVEGVSFLQNFDRFSVSRPYLDFKQVYQQRLGREPTFASFFAYEAAQVVFAGLAQSSDPERLKSFIISQGKFSGLQGDFVIDRYGDAERLQLLMVVKNGRFVP